MSANPKELPTPDNSESKKPFNPKTEERSKKPQKKPSKKKKEIDSGKDAARQPQKREQNIKEISKLDTRAHETYGGMSEADRNQLNTINRKLADTLKNIGKIKAQYENRVDDKGNSIPMPEEIRRILNEIEMAIENYDPATGTQRGTPDYNRLYFKIEQLKNSGALSTEQGFKLEDAVEALQLKEKILEKYSGISDSYRLREVGIVGHQQDVYYLATEPEKFMNKLREVSQNAQREAESRARSEGKSSDEIRDAMKSAAAEARRKFYTKFREDVFKLCREILSIIDSDPTQFSDQVFSSLFHEPVYNNLITGLDKIANKIKDLELHESSEATIVQIDKFDPDMHKYNPKEYTLSEAIKDLKDWVIDERFWKRYTHNIYVLMITHNYESFSRYAQYVQTDAMQRLYDNNPELEEALRFHMQYEWTTSGLNYWKSFHHMYTPDRFGDIAVDKYVMDRLLSHRGKLNEADRKRLASLARGVALGVTLQGVDLILTNGPVEKGSTGQASLTEQFGPLHWNPFITIDRFGADFPFPDHDYLYVPVGGKKHFPLGWRSVAKEMYEAQMLQKETVVRERNRIFTSSEVEKEGIPFAEIFDFVSQAGGFYLRRGRWRWQESLKHFLRKDNKAVDLQEAIRLIAVADPAAANHILEQRYGITGDKSERAELRRIAWERILKDIAPQASIIMFRDLLFSNEGQKILQSLLENNTALFQDIIIKKDIEVGKSVLKDRYVIKDTGSRGIKNPLDQLILDCEAISSYLIDNSYTENGKLQTKTIEDLLENKLEDKEDKWYKALFGERTPRDDNEKQEWWDRAHRAKEFMLALRNNMSDKVINGGISIFETDYVDPRTGKAKKYKMPAIIDAEIIRSMPTHYGIKREIRWENMGERVLGRLVGDATSMAESWMETFKIIRNTIFDIQTHPEKAQETQFFPVLQTLRDKIANPMQDVHGTESSEIAQAQVYMAGYALVDMLTRWFDRGTAARHIPFLSILSSIAYPIFPYTSWVYRQTESKKAEIESQVIRRVAEQAVDLNLMAPFHGHMITKSSTWFMGRQWPIQHYSNWYPVKIGKKELFRIPKLTPKSPWNYARFQQERGAMNINLAIDIAEKWVPLVMIFLAIAALQQGIKDTEEK